MKNQAVKIWRSLEIQRITEICFDTELHDYKAGVKGTKASVQMYSYCTLLHTCKDNIKTQEWSVVKAQLCKAAATNNSAVLGVVVNKYTNVLVVELVSIFK